MAKVTGNAVINKYSGDQHNSFYEEQNHSNTDYGTKSADTTRVYYTDTESGEFKSKDTRLVH